jgi:hypothetical protein
MTDANIYNLLKVFAGVLAVASAMIAVAVNLPDLGLTKQGVAILAVVQAGISATIAFLPQINKVAGTIRGDSRDN